MCAYVVQKYCNVCGNHYVSANNSGCPVCTKRHEECQSNPDGVGVTITRSETPATYVDKSAKWDRRFLDLAEHIAQWSKDTSTKCGAVIVDDKQRIVSMGYNGFPRGVNDTIDRMNNRDLKYALTVHAEMNAVTFATQKLDGCTIYVHPMGPCSRCAATIIQSGITRVVSLLPSEELQNRWGESMNLTRKMFEEAGVIWKEITM